MILTYVTDDSNTSPYWYAETNSANYDGMGSSPLDAVCALVNQIEKELTL